jgi:hypothetical protein
MSAGLKEATVFGRAQGMVLTILEYVERASGVRGTGCATVGIAGPLYVSRLQTAKANVKGNHSEKDTHQTLTAMSTHLIQYFI